MATVDKELDSAFFKLIGRQSTDQERIRLYRVKDALQLNPDDSLWLVLIVLEHYSTLYETIPRKIKKVMDDASHHSDEKQVKLGLVLFFLFLGAVFQLVWQEFVSSQVMQLSNIYWVGMLCIVNIIFQAVLFFKKRN